MVDEKNLTFTRRASDKQCSVSRQISFYSKLLCFAFLFALDASACDFCLLGQGVSPYLTQTGRGVTLDVNTVALDRVYNKSTAVDSHGKKETWTVYSVTGFYPLTDDLTVLLMIPYALKTNIDYDGSSNTNPGVQTSGIGDLALTGRYTVFRKHSLDSTMIVGALGGVKFPTGPTSITNQQGQAVDRHVLPGTGSYDFNLGFTATYSVASGFQTTLDAVDQISTTGDWNGRSHKYGNILNYAWKAYQRVAQTASGQSFMPFVGVSGETTGKETGTQTDAGYDPNQINPSTGGTVLYWNLGLYSILSPTTFLNFGLAKSFYHYENFDPAFDADPAENYRLDLSVTFLF